jgi:hypothetical protein
MRSKPIKEPTNPGVDIFDDLFHFCAFEAFVTQATAEGKWPDADSTRNRAYSYYEAALAIKNASRTPKPIEASTALIGEAHPRCGEPLAGPPGQNTT